MMSRPIKWRRIYRRLLWHHLPLALGTFAFVGGMYVAMPDRSSFFRLSMGTAYAGLALIGGTLVTGPLKVLRGQPNPVSDDLRRDVGIWAALVTTVHVVIGLQRHFSGQMWRYFFDTRGLIPVRIDLFGFANYTGALGLLIALMLLALSNDLSLRTLGVERWKGLQRWNYGLLALTVLHGAAYQVLEDRALFYVAAFIGLTLLVLTAQWMGRRRKRRIDRSKRSMEH